MLPLPPGRARQLTDGQPVSFGVRPEYFTPAHEGRAARKGNAAVVVPVSIELDEPTGSETILMTRIAGQDAVIVCEPDEAPEPGSSMDFEIDMSKISLFDPASELRL